MIRVFRGLLKLLMVAAILAAPQPTVYAGGQRGVQHRARLDVKLRAVLDESAPEPQRVIIRVRSGTRGALRNSLQAHGDLILTEHSSPDTLTAVVHGKDLGELAAKDFVLSVSTDAIVWPDG